MLSERPRRTEFINQALGLASILNTHLTEELLQIPEFKNDEAQAILDGKLGVIEATRHEGKKILRFVRRNETVDVIVEGKKDKDRTERQKALILPANNRKSSRLPVFEYSESKTQTVYDLPRERNVLLRDCEAAFERSEEFIRDLKKFRQ